MEAAVQTMTQPFVPTLQKVAEREIVVTITKRIDTWSGHATIIAGRYGSGKTVALEEALRDRQGVFVHKVKDADWEEQLFKRLGLDGPDMFEEVLRRVGGKLQRPPILVLDIPRSAKRGGALRLSFPFATCFSAFRGMDTVSSFAKTLSSDGLLAHAGARRLSRCVLLGCGRVLQVVRALPR